MSPQTNDDSEPSDEEIRVCHVVNDITETTGPANHAVALNEYTSVEAGIVGWFESTGLDGPVETHCLDAPETSTGIDRRVLREALDVFSRYDILHTHHPHSGTFTKLVARYLGLPVVFTYGTPSFRYTRKGRLSSGLTNVFADRITCVSPAVRDSLRGWERVVTSRTETEVVYTGVDTEQIRTAQEISWSVRDHTELPESCLLIGHAGRLIETKAQDDLIRSVGRVQRELDDDVYVVIAGDGEEREKLRSVAEQEGVASNVVFLGLISRERVYKMMGELDVFAMPSKWEGFSSAATEAMAVGTPCVLSDIQAFREPFEGVAKFHPVGDVERMSDQILELLSDETAREELGTAAKERVKARFTIRRTAEEYARIYREII